MSTAQKTPSDELIIGAMSRAEHQSRTKAPGASRGQVLQHLALFNTRTKEARHVKTRLEALTDEGVLEREKRHGIFLWHPTASARRRAARARSSVELPESPQHCQWREARERAPGEVERGCQQLGDALHEAHALLDGNQAASSDAWFLAGIRLSEACETLATATYGLREWQEPDGTRADVDERSEPAAVPASPEEFRTLVVLRYKRRSPASPESG